MELIKLEKVEILFDDKKTKYQCGETISGTVIIKLNGKLEMSRVNIVLRSMSEVDWVETFDGVYCNDHDTEQHEHTIYDIPNSIRNTTVTKGEQSISFEYRLPDNIPSSLETEHGFIKSWIEFIINDDSLAKEVYNEKKYFSVERPFRYGLKLSVSGGIEKEFGTLSLASGKVRIYSSIRKKGHFKGETVEVHCLVTNTSTVAVTPRASLYQVQIFMGKMNHKTLGYSSDLVIGEQVIAGETKEQTISVQIPTDMPLSIKTRLITIKYFIHITLDIPHAFDVHLNLPIVVTNEYALFDKSV